MRIDIDYVRSRKSGKISSGRLVRGIVAIMDDNHNNFGVRKK